MSPGLDGMDERRHVRGMAPDTDRTRDFLIYDGDCPVCARYVAWTALRRAHPGIELIDAREAPGLVAELREEGVEINDTYLLQLDGARYIEAAAMARISALMVPETIGQRLLKLLTRSRRLMTPAYPLLARGRKLLLWLMGREQIR